MRLRFAQSHRSAASATPRRCSTGSLRTAGWHIRAAHRRHRHGRSSGIGGEHSRTSAGWDCMGRGPDVGGAPIVSRAVSFVRHANELLAAGTPPCFCRLQSSRTIVGRICRGLPVHRTCRNLSPKGAPRIEAARANHPVQNAEHVEVSFRIWSAAGGAGSGCPGTSCWFDQMPGRRTLRRRRRCPDEIRRCRGGITFRTAARYPYQALSSATGAPRW